MFRIDRGSEQAAVNGKTSFKELPLASFNVAKSGGNHFIQVNS
jgi:hypothetical protein